VFRPRAGQPPVFDIRFSRRIARQCRLPSSRVPDWAVCDAIVNGSRAEAPGRGPCGGRLFRFERTYPARNGAFQGQVVVLGELTRLACHALRLLRPARGGKKSGMVWDF
jgi:hypothetical protein